MDENEREWGAAIDDFLVDGYMDRLAKLVQSEKPMPQFARFIVSGILIGDVEPPDIRGRKNSQLTPDDKECVKSELFTLWHRTQCILAHIDHIADEEGREAIEIRRYVESIRKRCIESIADRYAVSESTIRQFNDVKEIRASVARLKPSVSLNIAQACMQHPKLMLDI